MYITQLTYLDEQKDIEQRENEESRVKFKEFLTKELEKKSKLEKEVTKYEQRTQELFDHRNNLSSQVNDLQAVLRKKKEQRTEERAKLQIKK